ncbi:hypothetical protein [Sporolactobacillus spathodeae]|uniref:Uncharacterized protein n=1 Tax=Sporolactobacillus spathodeae TaxID=1465502 RepID=A0ABS2QAS4_9BACL|nr:hypothetical protein [Sporolactobacillus spathodeae]MBM7658530.1 hypothetical protein [Sporolactobacillus spathodeae]
MCFLSVGLSLATSQLLFAGDAARRYSADNTAYSADSQPYSADSRPYSADSQPYSVDSRPYSADSRPYSTDVHSLFASNMLRLLACRGQDGSLLGQPGNLRGLPCPALPAGVSRLRCIFRQKSYTLLCLEKDMA